MSISLDNLNENQRKAAAWNDGPLLVLAGPGSGKTRVLTLRIARLLEEHPEASVLALTFTNKAAGEMRERVDQLLGQRGDRAHLCTFHAFATDVLRQHGSHLGLRPDFSLLTQEEDRIAILDGVANDLATDDHVLPPDRKGLLELLDRLFSESYDGVSVPPALGKTPEWVPLLFRAYVAALIAANRLDFGSLLGLTQQLLRDKPAVARVLRLAWTYVCVDEFQDTNKAQYDILRLLVPTSKANLFVVGDDDQIIYQWNGASPERLQSLKSDYKMNVVQLPQNFRCPPEIITLANKLISHNKQRTADKKPLTTVRPAGTAKNVVRYVVYEAEESELAGVAEDIRARKLAPTDVVVLARTTKLLGSAARALEDANFEVWVAKRKSDFFTPVVRVVMHSLRSANARHDRSVLRRLCVAWSEMEDQSLEFEDVAASAALHGGDFLRAWTELAEPSATNKSRALIKRIRSGLVDRLLFPEIVDWFLETGHKVWADEEDREFSDEIGTWKELHQQIVREQGPDNLTLNVYLQLMDLAPKSARPGPRSIACMTVHGAKGLEFKHVYLLGMAQEVLPSYHSLKKGPASKEVEEERRNCFVAITRVQESLTLTRATEYGGWNKRPSQFIAEMGLTP